MPGHIISPTPPEKIWGISITKEGGIVPLLVWPPQLEFSHFVLASQFPRLLPAQKNLSRRIFRKPRNVAVVAISIRKRREKKGLQDFYKRWGGRKRTHISLCHITWEKKSCIQEKKEEEVEWAAVTQVRTRMWVWMRGTIQEIKIGLTRWRKKVSPWPSFCI